MAQTAQTLTVDERKEAARLGALLKDREWRLDTLYHIKAEDGTEIQFVRNEAQRAYYRDMWSRDLILKSRRLGFSTFIAILSLDECLFIDGTEGAIVDVKLEDAKNKLAMIKFAYERIGNTGYQLLGDNLRATRRLVKDNQELLSWSNKSKMAATTSARGSGKNILHVSEYGKISMNTPDVAIEIQTGSIEAVPKSGWCAVESTAHGTGGKFYDMVERAKAKQQEGSALSVLDFKLHFFGWWIKKEHRLPNNQIALTENDRIYFAKIAPILKDRNGIILDANQKAWYAQKRSELGPDKTFEEHPSIIEETFFNSIEGVFWKEEISAARNQGRIGKPVPYDPTRPVHTAWDIGEDCTAIIFFQTDDVSYRHIDYYEEEGGSIQRGATVLDDKRRERGFLYGKHYGPHDLKNKDWGNNAQDRYTTALGLGIKFEVIERIQVKADSIEAGRRHLGVSWFCSEHCGLLVQRLENYRKKWNNALGVFMADPVHDASSHGSDAFQQEAMGVKPDRVKRDRPKREKHKSAWGM